MLPKKFFKCCKGPIEGALGLGLGLGLQLRLRLELSGLKDTLMLIARRLIREWLMRLQVHSN